MDSRCLEPLLLSLPMLEAQIQDEKQEPCFCFPLAVAPPFSAQLFCVAATPTWWALGLSIPTEVWLAHMSLHLRTLQSPGCGPLALVIPSSPSQLSPPLLATATVPRCGPAAVALALLLPAACCPANVAAGCCCGLCLPRAVVCTELFLVVGLVSLPFW